MQMKQTFKKNEITLSIFTLSFVMDGNAMAWGCKNKEIILYTAAGMMNDMQIIDEPHTHVAVLAKKEITSSMNPQWATFTFF